MIPLLLTVLTTDYGTRRRPLTIPSIVKGLITLVRLLITQFRVLITLLLTRGAPPCRGTRTPKKDC